MNCPIVFKKATLEDEGEYLRLSKLFYATDAVLSPLPEEFHKNIFKEICRSSAYLEAFLFSFAGEIAGYGLVSKRFSTEAGGLECWVEDLFVLPEFRGKGIGGAFLDFVKKSKNQKKHRLNGGGSVVTHGAAPDRPDILLLFPWMSSFIHGDITLR